MTQSYVLRVPAPEEWINANARAHWAVTSRRVKAWRRATALCAQGASLPTIREHVRITATIHKKHGRRYDASNWAPTGKACVDGLRDAGVLLEDDNKHVTGPDMRAGEKSAEPYLLLTITPTGETIT